MIKPSVRDQLKNQANPKPVECKSFFNFLVTFSSSPMIPKKTALIESSDEEGEKIPNPFLEQNVEGEITTQSQTSSVSLYKKGKRRGTGGKVQ